MATMLLASIFALSVFVPVAGELSASAHAISYSAELTGRGYDTLIVKRETVGADAPTIAASECASMSQLAGVEASGGVVAVPGLRLWDQRGPLVSVWRVSGSILHAVRLHGRPVGPDGARFDAVFDSGLAIDPALSDNADVLVGVNGPQRFTAVRANVTFLGLGFAKSVVLAGADREVERCIIVVSRNRRQSIFDSVSARFPVGLNYFVSWSMEGANQTPDEADVWSRRLTRRGWPLPPLVAGTLFAVYIRQRRADIAVYRLAGAAQDSVAKCLILEACMCIGVGCAVWSPSVWFALRQWSTGSRVDAAQVGVAALCVLGSMLVLTTFWASSVDVFSAIRDGT